jgi:bifunctional pyridoxal-dependent enzyme with beta-cystathionase and maltose regulon repressor activities
MVYADDENWLDKNINTINKNTDILLDATKEAGLEVHTEETKFVFMSLH